MNPKTLILSRINARHYDIILSRILLTFLSLLVSSETARLQFLLEFGPVLAWFIEALLFLRFAYEPHCVHKKSKNVRRGRTPG